jgi:hypothetical protein
MKAGSEAAFQAQVEQLAAFYGWNLRYHPPDNIPRHTRTGRVVVQDVTAGFPDLWLIREPELVVAELKTEKGRLSPAQERWIAALTACGLEVYIWRPSDFDDIHARLSRDRHRTEPLYRTAA